ncbi:MAG: hypothetical protein FWF54_03240 [Candidatus Azobacteroides sp.]|nr:hypothetical protein [Candidatus Azobacteroides sp.]
MKPKISGANLSLEFENIESSLYKVAATVPGNISQELYDRLVKNYINNTTDDKELTAVDYLQRAMLHFTVFEHVIFLIAQISNDGITTKKNDSETTIFKYQQDELNNKLITTGWFWMNQLIQFLNKNEEVFSEWAESKEKKAFDELPVNLSDFNKWVGVESTGGEYFMLSAGWIIREVWLDCVCSRIEKPEKTDSISRAVCYEVMGRACERLAYSCLPEPVRRDIDNEMGKNHKQQADKDIRERIAEKFLIKARLYWNIVDLEIKKKEIAGQKKERSSQPVIGQKNITEEDKFCLS